MAAGKVFLLVVTLVINGNTYSSRATDARMVNHLKPVKSYKHCMLLAQEQQKRLEKSIGNTSIKSVTVRCIKGK